MLCWIDFMGWLQFGGAKEKREKEEKKTVVVDGCATPTWALGLREGVVYDSCCVVGS